MVEVGAILAGVDLVSLCYISLTIESTGVGDLKMRKSAAMLTGIALACAAAAPAAASVMIARYTGTVTSWTDSVGSITGFTGQNFTAYFAYDTTLGTPTNGGLGATGSSTLGNIPILTAALVLSGGYSVQFTPNYGTSSWVNTPTWSSDTANAKTTYWDWTDTDMLTFTVMPPSTAMGSFTLKRKMNSTGALVNNITGNLTPANFSTYAWTGGPNINFLGAVPEPSTWAVMITGLGAVGAVLRRKRRQALPTAA